MNGDDVQYDDDNDELYRKASADVLKLNNKMKFWLFWINIQNVL